LFGVLREIVSLQSGPKPADSKVFTGDLLVHGQVADLVAGPDPMTLPGLRVNLEDRGANEVIRVLSLMDAAEQVRELLLLVKKYGSRATEPRLRLAEVLILNPQLSSNNRMAVIENALQEVETQDPFDWRPSWYRGVWMASQKKGAQALTHFERCYFEMPGELAPRLGMGMASEIAGNIEQALPYYDRVGQVDPAFVTAHVGAARCQAKVGHLDLALAAIERVPTSHAMNSQCKLAMGELLLAHPKDIDTKLLTTAERAVGSTLDAGAVAAQIAGRLCTLAANLAQQIVWPASQTFLGHGFSEKDLRLNAEALFRRAAKLSATESERFYWVCRANTVRPVTLF
jgi:serine/threonine-protein kinase PknG